MLLLRRRRCRRQGPGLEPGQQQQQQQPRMGAAIPASADVRASLSTDWIRNSKRNGRRIATTDGRLVKRKKKKNQACSRRSLVEDARNTETVTTRRVCRGRCHRIPQFAFYDPIWTILGRDFQFSRSARSTAWRISSLPTLVERYIRKCFSAISCTRTWPRCSRCSRRWCLPHLQHSDINGREKSKRRSISSIRDTRRR